MNSPSSPDVKSCPHAPTCPLYDLFTVKSALSVWKTFYCDNRFLECERHQRSQRGETVPNGLLPNGRKLDL